MAAKPGMEAGRIDAFVPKAYPVSWTMMYTKSLISETIRTSGHKYSIRGKTINQPEMTWAVSKSLLIAADGTKVRSAALWRNPVDNNRTKSVHLSHKS